MTSKILLSKVQTHQYWVNDRVTSACRKWWWLVTALLWQYSQISCVREGGKKKEEERMSGQQLEQSWRLRGRKTTHLFPHIHTFFSVKLRCYGFVYNKSLSDKIWLYLVRHTNSSNMPWLSPSKNRVQMGTLHNTRHLFSPWVQCSLLWKASMFLSWLLSNQSCAKFGVKAIQSAQSLGSAWGSADACCQHKGPDVSPLRLLKEMLRPLTPSLSEWDHIPMKWVGS